MKYLLVGCLLCLCFETLAVGRAPHSRGKRAADERGPCKDGAWQGEPGEGFEKRKPSILPNSQETDRQLGEHAIFGAGSSRVLYENRSGLRVKITGYFQTERGSWREARFPSPEPEEKLIDKKYHALCSPVGAFSRETDPDGSVGWIRRRGGAMAFQASYLVDGQWVPFSRGSYETKSEEVTTAEGVETHATLIIKPPNRS